MSPEGSARSIRKAVPTVIWRTLLFFVGGVTLIAVIVPWNQLPDPAEQALFSYIFGLFGILAAENLMTAVILTAAYSVLNSAM